MIKNGFFGARVYHGDIVARNVDGLNPVARAVDNYRCWLILLSTDRAADYQQRRQ